MLKARQRRDSRWKKRSNVSLLLIACLALGFVGCNELPFEEVERNRPYVAKVDEFLPLDAKQPEAAFWCDGTQSEYTLKTSTKGTQVTFQALSGDMVVDEEVYDVQGGKVLLQRAGGENFVEPIPLLEFPLSIGDKYEWKGDLSCSEEKHEGTATIITSSDFVRLKDKSQDAVKVEINLKIDKESSRKLSFWFVKGMGVLKTEMGKNVREPKI